MISDKNKMVTTWHIDQTYLESIWGRMDSYNKGLENATNLKLEQRFLIYKQCWMLMKNIYNDFSPYMKDFDTEFKVLEDLEVFFWSSIPTDERIKAKWRVTLKAALKELDKRKRIIIQSLAKVQALLTHTIKYSEMDKIKGVMRDE